MKLSLNWLKDYIHVAMPPDEIARTLTLLGLEVDSIEVQGSDVLLEISLTPNLGHCNSVIGIARELSAVSGEPYKLPKRTVKEDSSAKITDLVSVEVLSPKGCPRYGCRAIQGIVVGPSPDWLKQRLEQAGLRSVNNVVDVTNYVMLELGHSLHAFDADRLSGHKIIVKNAVKGEHFTTLDGKERLLEAEDLVICDKDKPIALAGVMGGLNSEVDAGTKNIVLEAACFSPQAIRKTSKRHGLITDASKRFERGCDLEILPVVLDRAAELITQVAGGRVATGIIDKRAGETAKKRVSCRLSRVNKLLGTRLSAGEVEAILKSLEMAPVWESDDLFAVEPPTYRNDINEEVDLIEEVARGYGLDNISKPATFYQSTPIPHDPVFLFEREVRTRLVGEGLQEFLTCDLIGPTILNIVEGDEISKKMQVKVMNPTSVEQSIMRTSLLPGLLQVVKYNWDRQNHDIAGFEIGRIHYKEKDRYCEPTVVAFVLAGKSGPHCWSEKPKESDFFDLKGMIENFLAELQVPDVAFKPNALAAFHPGRQAAIYAGDLEVGSLGEVHPTIVRKLDVPQRILFAELNLQDLMRIRTPTTLMKSIPVFPGSERDWTLTLKEEVPIDAVFHAVHAVPSSFLEKVVLLDIYRSDKLGRDLKNATFRFTYRDRSKTISQGEVDTEHARIVSNVSKTIV